MAKIHKVAELAGVSTATVSRALAGKSSVSPATRAKVETAARELNYVVSAAASSLASGKTRNIGIILPLLDSWFFMAVLKGAQRLLEDAGYDVTLYHLPPASELDHEAGGDGSTRRTRMFDEFLRRQRVDAFIAVNLELDDEERALLATLKRPLVGLGGVLPGLHTVTLDDVAVARLATEHLLNLGHTHIAHITGEPDFEWDFQVPGKRRMAYEEALSAAGIEPDPLLVRTGNFTIPSGYEATKQLLGDPRVHPTAIFAASDEMAIGAILAARDMGLSIPQDLSVIGIDGHDLSEFFGLTTIDQFPELQGRQVAQLILDELDGSAAEDLAEELPHELVVRTSTAAPPRAER